MSTTEKSSLIEKIIDKINTRDILSIGALTLIAYGVYSRYFPSEGVLPILAMAFAYWFAAKKTENSST